MSHRHFCILQRKKWHTTATVAWVSVNPFFCADYWQFLCICNEWPMTLVSFLMSNQLELCLYRNAVKKTLHRKRWIKGTNFDYALGQMKAKDTFVIRCWLIYLIITFFLFSVAVTDLDCYCCDWQPTIKKKQKINKWVYVLDVTRWRYLCSSLIFLRRVKFFCSPVVYVLKVRCRFCFSLFWLTICWCCWLVDCLVLVTQMILSHFFFSVVVLCVSSSHSNEQNKKRKINQTLVGNNQMNYSIWCRCRFQFDGLFWFAKTSTLARHSHIDHYQCKLFRTIENPFAESALFSSPHREIEMANVICRARESNQMM